VCCVRGKYCMWTPDMELQLQQGNIPTTTWELAHCTIYGGRLHIIRCNCLLLYGVGPHDNTRTHCAPNTGSTINQLASLLVLSFRIYVLNPSRARCARYVHTRHASPLSSAFHMSCDFAVKYPTQPLAEAMTRSTLIWSDTSEKERRTPILPYNPHCRAIKL
jgi:hypothetical protein